MSTNIDMTKDEAVNAYCLIMKAASLESNRGDVSEMIQQAFSLVRNHVPELSDNLGSRNVDAVQILLRGFHMAALSAVQESLTHPDGIERTEALFRVVEAISNADNVKAICDELAHLNNDEEIAATIAQNAAYERQADESRQAVEKDPSLVSFALSDVGDDEMDAFSAAFSSIDDADDGWEVPDHVSDYELMEVTPLQDDDIMEWTESFHCMAPPASTTSVPPPARLTSIPPPLPSRQAVEDDELERKFFARFNKNTMKSLS